VRPSMDPSTRFVRSLDGDYYMLREAAEVLGVKHTLLRSLMRDPDHKDLGPTFCTFFGKIKLYLYTKEDIARIREYLTKRKQVFRNSDLVAFKGRPRIWSPEQRKERNKLYSKAYYYRKKVEQHTASGDTAEAARAQAVVDECQAKLDNYERGSDV
jgi:hypothetical protein